MNYPQGYLFCWIDCQNSSHSTLTYPSDILGYYFTQYQSISASFRDELPSGLLFCWTGRNTGYSNRSKGASLTVSLAWSLASWDPCPVPCQLGPLPTVSDRKASLCWKNHHHIWGLLAISGPPAVHLKLGFWWHMMHLYSYTGTFYPSKESSRASNLTWRLIWTIWEPQGLPWSFIYTITGIRFVVNNWTIYRT